MTTKQSINLLQAELFPEKPLLTLAKMLGIWGILLVVMIAWAVLTQLNLTKVTAKYQQLLQEQQFIKQQVGELESQLKNRQVSADLSNKLARIKLVMQHKDALLNKLTNAEETFAGGFVMAMNDLSAMHHQDIRLQTISINANNISFTGLARNPQAVPAWLAGFKASRLLSGKAFVQFKLAKNDDNITEFVVSSIAQKDKS